MAQFLKPTYTSNLVYGKGNNTYKGPTSLPGFTAEGINVDNNGNNNGGNNGGWSSGLMAGAGSAAGLAATVGADKDNPYGLFDRLDPVHALAGGRHSGAGDAMGGLGVGLFQTGVSSGNPMLMLAGAGVKVLGGLTNAAFGIKENKNLKKAAESNINRNNAITASAENFDDITMASGLVNSDIYEGGWFSGGRADEKNEEMRNRMVDAYNRANRNIQINVDNLRNNQLDTAALNFFSMGGSLNSPLHSHGADWTNGVISINNGGTHESNPYEGVLMGIAPDGQPNLVEEGEVIYNDYVFSNRIKVPKAIKEKYKLRGAKDMTFAEAAKKAQKESEERPNDPISKRGLEDIMGKLMVEQETIRQKKREREQREAIAEQNEILGSVFAEGGSISIKPSKRGTFTAAATKHGMGVQEFATEVLSNPDKYSPKMRQKANFARNASGWKHALGGHLFDGEDNLLEQRTQNLGLGLIWDKEPETIAPTSPILDLNKSFLPQLAAIKNAQRVQRGDESVLYATDNNTNLRNVPGNKYIDALGVKEVQEPFYIDETGTKDRSNWITNLRYAPALGAGIGVFSDLMGWTNTPDYSGINSILAEADSAGKTVSPTYIGDYMRYTPLDRLFYSNQLAAQAGATRRAIANASGSNRGTAMSGILAADYNAQGRLGDLYRKAEEYNLAQRKDVATFNRDTNKFNAENNLRAQIASRDASRARLDAAIRAAALRDQINARASAARSANLTNLFDNLGNIGIDAYNRRDRDMLIRAGVYGTLSEKPQDWSEERWKAYRKALTGEGYKKDGGKLNKKRGITF